jgi:hypothetical protein
VISGWARVIVGLTVTDDRDFVILQTGIILARWKYNAVAGQFVQLVVLPRICLCKPIEPPDIDIWIPIPTSNYPFINLTLASESGEMKKVQTP